MKYREIKRHHMPAIISIAALLIIDILAFYLAYLISEQTASEFIGIKYPIRVLIIIIYLNYIIKRYNPSPRMSRGNELKIIIQLFYMVGIGYIFYKIIFKSINIDKTEKISQLEQIINEQKEIIKLLKKKTPH